MSREKAEIVEVGPRDGLQNEPTPFDTPTKVAFISRLLDAGIQRLEAASFVHPKRVPQMADAEAVMAAVPRDRGATYIGLVLNRRGLDRALESQVDEINYPVVASDTFSQRNQGTDMARNLAVWEEISKAAAQAGIPCGATISAAFGCPFEGEVPLERVVDMAARVADTGASEISLADTIGVADPASVSRQVEAVRKVIGDLPLRMHFHNTRNTGLANAYAAYEAGVRVFDASCGGIGGCPFAPAATGNIPTEDLLYMLGRMGVDTGISAQALIETTHWLEQQLDGPVPAMVSKAGLFPSREEAA